MQEVVITSFGSVNGAGLTASAQWENILAGGPEFVSVDALAHTNEGFHWFDLEPLHKSVRDAIICPVRHTHAELGEMANVNPKEFDRHQLLAFMAANEAMDGVEVDDPTRFACVGANGGAGLLESHEAGRLTLAGKRLSPRTNLRYLSNLFVGYLTQRHGIAGPSNQHGTACAAGLHALIGAARLIRTGEADAALVVGTEAAISPFGLMSFQSQRALGSGRPFHVDRDGFVMGEGAAAVVLEGAERARHRNAHIYATIVGYGESSDAVQGGLITDPSPSGAERAMRIALTMAASDEESVDLVKAHATGTPNGDRSEIEALTRVFGERYVGPYVTAPKSFFGHLLGAAGVAEAVTALQMMRKGIVLPTRFLSGADIADDCQYPWHVTKQRKRSVKRALLNGFGFGGTNASLVLQKYTG